MLYVRNIRGCESAEIETDSISLIAGKNAHGKSSVIQAAAAVASGRVIPIEGLTKSHAGKFMRTGSKDAEVIMRQEDAQSRVIYPTAERSTDGDFQEISPTAAGLESILDLRKKDRASVVCEIIGGNPTPEQLSEALQNHGCAPEKALEIVNNVKEQGWDNAHAVAKEDNARRKGRWEGITGDRYGSKKAESWIPPAYTPDLADADLKELEGSVKQEQEWLETAISEAAVASEDVARLKADAEKLDAATDSFNSLSKELSALFNDEQNIKKHGRSLPRPEQPPVIKCPHCDGDLNIKGVSVIKATALSEDEIKNRQEVIDETATGLHMVQERIKKLNEDRALAQSEKIAAEKASKKLADLKAAPSPGSSETVDQIRGRLEHAQQRLSSYKAMSEASAVSIEILDNNLIISVLAPAGLRQQVLEEKLSAFNARMKQITDCAAWGAVQIKPNMSIVYNGTDYMLLSESEQFRVRVTIQIAIAQLEGACMLLIDRADILDPPGRNGLIKTVKSTGIPAIIAMTIGNRESVPPMDKIGGHSYWIENGKADKING